MTIVESLAFEAGNITVLVTDDRRHRRGFNASAPLLNEPVFTASLDMHSAYSASAPDAAFRARRRACDAVDSESVLGDVDCNCKFTPADSLYVRLLHFYAHDRCHDSKD